MPRKIILIVSLIAGIGAAMLTKIYINGKEQQLAKDRQELADLYGTMEVVCFNADLPAGTVLARKDLGLKDVPEMGMRNVAVTREDVDEYIGKKTTVPHSRGDVLFINDVEGGDVKSRGLSRDIKRTMRAISINCSGAAAVSGIVKADDHVDVIGTFVFPQEDGKIRQGDIETCTLLQNVLVLAVGQSTAKSDLGTRSSSTVTLEVTPREAQVIAFAEQMKGRLMLTLRSRTDSYCVPELSPVDYEKIKMEMFDINRERKQRMGN